MQQGNSLVPIYNRTNVKLASGGLMLPAEATFGSLPEEIRESLLDLLAAYTAGPQQPSNDKKRLVQVYSRSMSEQPQIVVLQALRHLLFHNPRNPFPPSPQDVFEICKKFGNACRAGIIQYYFSGEKWGLHSFDYSLGFRAGAEPEQADCILTPDLVCTVLKSALDGSDYHYDDLARLPQDLFNRIPSAVFTDDTLRLALSYRQQYHLKVQSQEAYQREVEHLADVAVAAMSGRSARL